MKSIATPIMLLLFCGSLLAQNAYLEAPVSIPVLVEKTEKTPEFRAADLTGILLMAVYPADRTEQIMVNKAGTFSIRQEQHGATNLVTLASLENGVPLRFEFSTSAHVTFAACWYNADKVAEGRLLYEEGEYRLRLKPLNEHGPGLIHKALLATNRQLMSLNWQEKLLIPIEPHFISDTLNVVFGKDTQFDTSNDLLWFDKPLYRRLRYLAQETVSVMVDQKKNLLTESIGSAHDIQHEVKRQPMFVPTVKGSMKAKFKLPANTSLHFLPAGAAYELEVGYTAERFTNGQETFRLDRIALKHLDTQDFVDMGIFDLTNVGYNLLYVDLIKGVVTTDKGAWNMQQVLEVVEHSLGEQRFGNSQAIGASDF